MSKIIITAIIISLSLRCQAQTYYMKLEPTTSQGVAEGNSQHDAYPGSQGWSEIAEFNHVTSNEITGNQQIQSIPQCGIIEITKLYFPKTSNHLSQALHTGLKYKKVIIVGLVPLCGGADIEFVRYTFAHVFVGNFNKEVENSGTAFTLVDQISFRAAAMHVKHFTINPNCTTTETSTGWNFYNNTSWDGTGDPPPF